MVLTISPINSVSGLQLQAHPQLFFIIIIFFLIKRIEVSEHKIKINEPRKME